MKPLKRELEAVAAVLTAGAEDPLAMAADVFAAVDQAMADRSFFYGCYMLAGIPGVLGPYSTRGQAQKALEKHGAEKAWVVPGHTDEGLTRLMEQVDIPAEIKVSAKEQAAKDKGFWARAHAIREGEAPGMVAVEIKRVQL